MNLNQAIMDASAKYVGVKEFPGKASNAVVEEMFADAGHPGHTDDVPWCAAFVGAVLAEVGIQPSGSLMARSYEKWGMPVAPRDAKPGDVVVIPRGTFPSGHVFFFVRWAGDRVVGRGGNQGDAVTEASFPAASIIAIRRADPARETNNVTLSQEINSRHPSVTALQRRLTFLRYFAGRIDGVFGKLTAEAVMAFQNENKLEVDGVVGKRTWAALSEAEPRPLRDVSAADLRQAGSVTVASADTGSVIAYGTGAVAAATTAVDVLREASDAASGLREVVVENWQTLLLIGALVVIGVLFSRITKARVRDAQTGANVGR